MRKKKLLSLLLVGTMVAGLITGCGSSSKDTSKSDSGKSKGGKVVLNVINYHVGTDYAADYYKYLFDAFKKTDERTLNLILKKFLQQMHLTRRLNY